VAITVRKNLHLNDFSIVCFMLQQLELLNFGSEIWSNKGFSIPFIIIIIILCFLNQHYKGGNVEIYVELYTLPEVEIYKDSWDDIQTPRDTIPMVAKACPNSYTKFCCSSDKFCQSVRLCKSQNHGKKWEKLTKIVRTCKKSSLKTQKITSITGDNEIFKPYLNSRFWTIKLPVGKKIYLNLSTSWDYCHSKMY
jgi:hypothetical protein